MIGAVWYCNTAYYAVLEQQSHDHGACSTQSLYLFSFYCNYPQCARLSLRVHRMYTRVCSAGCHHLLAGMRACRSCAYLQHGIIRRHVANRWCWCCFVISTRPTLSSRPPWLLCTVTPESAIVFHCHQLMTCTSFVSTRRSILYSQTKRTVILMFAFYLLLLTFSDNWRPMCSDSKMTAIGATTTTATK